MIILDWLLGTPRRAFITNAVVWIAFVLLILWAMEWI
jgi:hypothetical protein